MERDQCRLLFINPCLRRGASTKILPPGLAYVMTYAHEQGYRFDLLDIDLNEHDDNHVEEYIKTHRYDFILLGSIVTHYKWVKRFCRMAKTHQPESRIIVGNSVSGSIYNLFLEKCPADVAVIGEGEITTFEVLEAYRLGRDLGGVKGIAYRAVDGRIVKTERRVASPIDSLPMVNWDFFDVPAYIKRSATALSEGVEKTGEATSVAIPVVTARGCAFRCTFCHFVFWDDPYRHRSPESILAEIRRNIEKYGANYIAFWDDLSFASVKQVETLCDAILASGLKFNWNAAIRCDLFGKDKLPHHRRLEVARKMRDSGCLSVGFSLESGNEDILKMMNKKIEARYFIEQVQILREVGIVCNTSVVFGYPIETRETIEQTFDQCLKAGVYPSIGFLLPLPYTGMYEYAKEHGHITDEDSYLDSITERQDICLNMTKMSDQEIMDAIKDGGRRLNEALELGLTADRLVRTGGYKQHTNVKKQRQTFNPDDVKRNENDFSFNYSNEEFMIDAGLKPNPSPPDPC